MRILPNHDNFTYCGRIDWSNPEAPVFIYPCSSVQLWFTGNTLKIYVRNHSAYWNNYLGYILDGEQGVLPLPQEGDAAFEIKAEAQQGKEHDFLLFKRQDACHEFTFLGVELEEGEKIINYPVTTKRRMLVFGDSVSAGEVSEAVDYVGKIDPVHQGEYSNSWYSYAWITARKLNAQLHDIAQGGIALMDKTGWFCEPDAIGMETIWNKIRYNPLLGTDTQWNHAQYMPQLILVAIGQNDSHPQDYMAQDYNGTQASLWRNHYKSFLEKLRIAYPGARIICCTTLLWHDAAWDRAIGEVLQELGDKRITQYLFKRNGIGTPGHLRIPEAQEMAQELAAYIESLSTKGLIEGWNEAWEASTSQD